MTIHAIPAGTRPVSPAGARQVSDAQHTQAADPFLRKSLTHFRWPLLPGAGQEVRQDGAFAPVLEILRPAEAERSALLPQEQSRAGDMLLRVLDGYAERTQEAGETLALAKNLRAVIARQTDARTQFDAWRQSASPC